MFVKQGDEQMSKRSVEAAMDFSFPTPEERQAAMCVCCGSHCPGCESPDDYAWRRRDVDLSVLADEVIKTRLTPRERQVTEAYWFDGSTISMIAQKLGVCRRVCRGVSTRRRGKYMTR